MSALPDYLGMTVASTTISIRNAGDGLSKGMAISPAVLALGSRRYVLIEVDVDAHDHKRMKDTPDLLVLDQVLKAGVAVLVDADLAKPLIEEQRERIIKAEEEAKNLQRLPFDEGEIGLAHARGEHASGLVDGCPVCDSERAAAESENEPAPIAGHRKRTRK